MNPKIKKRTKRPNKNSRNEIGNKTIISIFKSKKFDFFIPVIIILSVINSLRAATSQYYLFGYADDIIMVYWASEHVNQPLTLLSQGPGNGYRPTYYLFYAFGYLLWGANEFYYYLLNGIVFAGAMVYLYRLIKLISDRLSGIIAVLLFLFLDASFILVWKMNYIVSIAEMFFIASSLYYSIHFFEKADKKSLVLAIVLAVFAFGAKEQSIVIIPLVNIMYLLHKRSNPTFPPKVKVVAILLSLAPMIFYFVVITFFSPEITISKSASLTELAKSRLIYYIEQELSWQLKNPYLLFLGCIGALYFYQFKHEKYGRLSSSLLKNVLAIVIISIVFVLLRSGSLYSLEGSLFTVMLLMVGFLFGDISQRLGVIWFAAGFAPLLFVSLGPVQPTYLAEPNMGMVLFIGVSLSKYLGQFFLSGSGRKPEHDATLRFLKTVNIIIVLIIIVLQLSEVPVQIQNTNNYQKMRAESETSFRESIDYIKVSVPQNGRIYYIPEEQRTKVGGEQIPPHILHELLCIKGRCDIRIELLSSLEISGGEKHPGEYIVLLSNLDIYLFFNEYKPMLRDDLYASQKAIKNGEYQALILGLA